MFSILFPRLSPVPPSLFLLFFFPYSTRTRWVSLWAHTHTHTYRASSYPFPFIHWLVQTWIVSSSMCMSVCVCEDSSYSFYNYINEVHLDWYCWQISRIQLFSGACSLMCGCARVMNEISFEMNYTFWPKPITLKSRQRDVPFKCAFTVIPIIIMVRRI